MPSEGSSSSIWRRFHSLPLREVDVDGEKGDVDFVGDLSVDEVIGWW